MIAGEETEKTKAAKGVIRSLAAKVRSYDHLFFSYFGCIKVILLST